MIRTLFIFGTRPEAIKLSPIVLHQRARVSEFQPVVCATAQHRDLLDQVLDVFGITPEYDLNLMLPGQTLFQSTARVIAALENVLETAKPHIILVQGDTTTAFCGALAGFYANIPVAHVEAGLRTGDMRQPFPEEMNRVLASRLASLHFAATDWARDNLLRERVEPSRIAVTGNSGIDALLYVRDALNAGQVTGLDGIRLDFSKKLILVTAHRRESFGAGFESICRALLRLADRGDAQIVYPVHPNPNVQDPVRRTLDGHANIALIEPLTYVPFVDLMRRAYLLLTDSGGVQEEGPSLGKPVLVMREKTERPEAVAAGTAKLVGANEERIFSETSHLLDSPADYDHMARAHNPYGDGQASRQISDSILTYFQGLL